MAQKSPVIPLALALALVSGLALALIAAPPPASAQGFPTSTFVWATPTDWDVSDAPDYGFMSEDMAQDVSQTAINGYRFLNQQGTIDFIVFVLMTALILALLIRAVKRMKEATVTGE